MRSATFTVRIDTSAKRRLERLAKNTGRTRSFLAAEAINEYLEINEWQVAGVKRAIASLDRGEGIAHDSVRDWVASWDSADEKPTPRLLLRHPGEGTPPSPSSRRKPGSPE